MKILQINKFFYRRGGADHHFLDLAHLLHDKGEFVTIFSMLDRRNEPCASNKYFVSNIDYDKGAAYLHPFRSIYSFEAARKLKKLIKVNRPDIAHLHLIYHHLSPSVLSVLKKEKIPIVMTIHDWKPLCPNYLMFTQGKICERCRGGHYIQCAEHKCIHSSGPQRLYAALEAYIHHAKRYYEDYVDVYIAPSEFAKEMFVKWGIKAEKIIVLPHFLPPAISREVKPSPLPDAPQFAFVGRLNAEKGIMTLVQKWLDEKISAPLHVFGGGPLAHDLKSFVAKNDLKNIILHGPVARVELMRRISEMTALIVPSEWYEVFGLVVLEAWAKGVPVITSRFGSLPGLVNDSQAGLTLDFASEPLGGALIKISDRKFRDNAVAYMARHHSADDYYKKLIQIYNSLITPKD